MGVPALSRAVFLDRDGVLNHTEVVAGVPHPPPDVASFWLLPGVAEACAGLRTAGFLLIVVTNQPDVRRGTQSVAGIEAIHRALRAALPVDDVLACYHDGPDGCTCRKPRPGMLLEAAARWDIDLPASFLVGDRWSDVEAGRAAGCCTILIRRDYSDALRCRPDLVAGDLAEAASFIIAQPPTDRCP